MVNLIVIESLDPYAVIAYQTSGRSSVRSDWSSFQLAGSGPSYSISLTGRGSLVLIDQLGESSSAVAPVDTPGQPDDGFGLDVEGAGREIEGVGATIDGLMGVGARAGSSYNWIEEWLNPQPTETIVGLPSRTASAVNGSSAGVQPARDARATGSSSTTRRMRMLPA